MPLSILFQIVCSAQYSNRERLDRSRTIGMQIEKNRIGTDGRTDLTRMTVSLTVNVAIAKRSISGDDIL